MLDISPIPIDLNTQKIIPSNDNINAGNLYHDTVETNI